MYISIIKIIFVKYFSTFHKKLVYKNEKKTGKCGENWKNRGVGFGWVYDLLLNLKTSFPSGCSSSSAISDIFPSQAAICFYSPIDQAAPF